MLVRVCCGERRVWSEVRVPTVADEAARQVSRERTALTQDQTRLVNQMRGWLATWGATLPSRRRGSLVDDACAIGRARRCPRKCKRGSRAPRRACRASRRRSRSSRPQQQAAVTTAAPASAVRQLVQLKGVATTSASVLLDEGLGVAGVPESAADRRPARLCADAVRQRRLGAGARDQSRGQCAAASDQHSARVELGAVATAERAHAVVSGELWEGQTRATDRDRRGGPQAGDRALAVRHDRRGPRRARF